MLLDELHIQCRLVQRASVQLEDGADHWVKLAHGQDFDRKFPPLDILAWCTVCLAGMAAIRRLLVDGEPKPLAKRRRSALQRLLDNPPLPNLASVTVRNSWEHLDDRLDTIIPKMTSGSISHLHVAAAAPGAETTALRRFDPLTLTIYFADQAIALRPAIAEVGALQDCLDEAMQKLQTEIVKPWK